MSEPKEPVTCKGCGDLGLVNRAWKLPEGWFLVRDRRSLRMVPICGGCWASLEANSHA